MEKQQQWRKVLKRNVFLFKKRIKLKSKCILLECVVNIPGIYCTLNSNRESSQVYQPIFSFFSSSLCWLSLILCAHLFGIFR